ncbi:DUF1707 domain-containing protein [Streptomyces sp. SID13666]|uniref:DUF1707 SHOCT-like domain-containing protein n=1 Tax=unclassified Streptomyces TaxID=2593676 RepID=UPI0013C1D738|nr:MULTISPECIES: DUF1707 domain-containing protein [unclassified Streptomyces]NEA54158.1 DUF1707 domain-containing protein [Streptomyces sp. SID13666]NEA70255.1 DUF1707 domain-containing protein [Streptomyces sp. SID13588]
MSGELVPDHGELRASHEDRDQVVERLRVAAGDGRLTAEELDERLEVALTARTYRELEAVLTDLPATGPAWAGGGVPSPAPKDRSRIAVDSASAKREGTWSVPRQMEIESNSGSVVLDFTRAVIGSPTLEIEASVRSGSVTLIVPPDVFVDVDEVAVSSGSVRHRAHVSAGTPIRLRIHVTGKVRSGSITVRPPKPPRRGFLQWLLRRPGPMKSIAR